MNGSVCLTDWLTVCVCATRRDRLRCVVVPPGTTLFILSLLSFRSVLCFSRRCSSLSLLCQHSSKAHRRPNQIKSLQFSQYNEIQRRRRRRRQNEKHVWPQSDCIFFSLLFSSLLKRRVPVWICVSAGGEWETVKTEYGCVVCEPVPSLLCNNYLFKNEREKRHTKIKQAKCKC